MTRICCILVFLAASFMAQAQSQSCSPSVPAVLYDQPGFSSPSVTVDMGTCFVFQGGSPTFTYDSSYSPLFGDLFVTSPVTIQLDYTSPGTFSTSFTVWACNNTCGTQLTAPYTFTTSGNGSYTTTLPMTFSSGMRLRIVEHVDVQDSDSQCFSFGYYCYFQARFTLRK